MAVRTTRLAEGTVTGTGSHTIYTAPANTVVIVKSLAEQNGGSGTSSWSFGLKPSGGTTTLDIEGHSTGSPQAAGAFELDSMWVALEAGDQLYIYINSGGPIVFWVSGTLLPE